MLVCLISIFLGVVASEFPTDICRIYIASFFGGIENDTWTLNVDSLWMGGPFQLEVHPLELIASHICTSPN